MKTSLFLLLGLIGATGSVNAATTTFDFESGVPAEFIGAGSVVPVGGLGGLNGFAGSALYNDGPAIAITGFNLTGLGTHDTVSLSFGLALIDSWDGSAGNFAPDFFNLRADGIEVFEISVAHFSSSNEVIPTSATGRTNPGDVFGDSSADTLFNVSFSFAHSSDSLLLDMFADGAGWQGGTDESWAIDNLTVTTSSVSAVPLPASGLMLGSLLAGLMGWRKLRKV